MNPTTDSVTAFRPTFLARTLAQGLLLGAFVATTAGCGGGGNNDAAVPETTPPPTTGDTYVLTSANRLLAFNRAAPATIISSRTVTVANVVGGDVRPDNGMLYVLSRAPGTGAGTLTPIDPATGMLGTPVPLVADASDTTSPYGGMGMGLTGTRFGVDFNPVVDRLRIVSDTGQNLRVNPTTGQVITDDNINPAVPPAMLVEAAYTNSLADACATRLLVINGTNGNLYTQNPPNAGTIGEMKSTGLTMNNAPLAPNDVVRFDIRTSSLSRADEAVVSKNNTIYSLNLDTGAATARGDLTLNMGETVTALFIAGAPAGSNPEPTVIGPQQGALAALVGDRVVSFNADTPQKLCSGASIQGLDAGEAILGVDYRPFNGVLYGVTSKSRLFTLNPFSGAAGNFQNLLPDVADTSDKFIDITGLPTTEDYGLDFEPTTDRLRLISTGGRNYRIDVANGQVTTDERLPTTSVATAAAYTNSAPLANPTPPNTPFAAPTATTLYVIDSGGNQLLTQSPNEGTQTPVGPLGVTGARLNGFDILSTRDATTPTTQTNVAYAALSVTPAMGGNAVTGLYTVNTGTGAATRVNSIGDGSGVVRGLTRAK